ncbi:unnamed protein product [Tilletia controversa]|uniref:Uncharacterized protein n=4 Tax=Tilletia TaxID=13289 RepID=A0A8X7MK48_9BASI|nr:hypothetical protein CF336_g7865 [Tilletia laevis]KAE8186381.1 hypothetical protein CF328_g7246 [Tilletia controversa]KAE8243428.1 hypothetical protein A4X03_0g7768 [Tilletia caries]KAE8239297.1 hypothetical protein A4X06_0g8370 [Tilletia controversa]CAD6884258.1 unnamed protein product [Tilletia caries]
MGVWRAQVEAQEAEIGPRRFQFQELFGLFTRLPPASLVPRPTSIAAHMPPLDEGKTGSASLVCLTNSPSTLLLPCMHGPCPERAVQ